MPRRPSSGPPEAPAPTRERILDAAEALIAVHGMEGLRLVDVARAVGVRPPSLFAHFAGRDAIGDAVAERVLARLDGVFAEVLDAPGRPEVLVRQGARAFAGHLYDHPSHARMLLRDLARRRGSGEVDLSSPVVDALVERVGEVLARGAAAGVFRRMDAGLFTSLLEGAILGAIGWPGFGEAGEPLLGFSRARLQDEAERLALALLRPDAPAPAR